MTGSALASMSARSCEASDRSRARECRTLLTLTSTRCSRTPTQLHQVGVTGRQRKTFVFVTVVSDSSPKRLIVSIDGGGHTRQLIEGASTSAT
jgi:hypothetical protein